jgi:hypothetical protein
MDTLEVTMQTNPNMFICKRNGEISIPRITVRELAAALNVGSIGGHLDCLALAPDCDRSIPYFFGLTTRRNNHKSPKEIIDAIIKLWAEHINPTPDTATVTATIDADGLFTLVPTALPQLETPRIQLGDTVYTLIPTTFGTIEDAAAQEHANQLDTIRTTARGIVNQNRVETGRRISQLEEQLRGSVPMVNISMSDMLSTGIRICEGGDQEYIVFFPSTLKTERIISRVNGREYGLKEEYCRSDEVLLGVSVLNDGTYTRAYIAGMNGEQILHPHSYNDYKLCVHPYNFPARKIAVTDTSFIQYAKAMVDSLLITLRAINLNSIARSYACDGTWQAIVNAGSNRDNIEAISVTTEELGWRTEYR